MIHKVEKSIVKFNDYSVKVDIDIPISGVETIDPANDEFMTEILVNQFIRGLERARERYKNSCLPNAFIDYQEYLITNNLPDDILGMFDGTSDIIYFDADTISDIRGIEASYVHGHEVGHKIIKYRRMNQCLNDIAHVLGVGLNGNEGKLKELLCDECGNLVAGTARDRLLFNHRIEKPKREYVQRKILYHIYR